MLAGLGLLDRFAAVVGGDEAPRKPDPAGALELMRRFGARREQTVFIGDSPTDVRTARHAGVAMVGVGWGLRPERELRAAGAVHVVGRVAELAPWLA
jgi:phosphoglycolate phosphatase